MSIVKNLLLFGGLKGLCLLAICIALFAFTEGNALASEPARSVTVQAGPYIIDINLYRDPPYTDQPLPIMVIPHERGWQLRGQIVAQPDLGTDAIPLRAPLRASGVQNGTLSGSISIPVRGAWKIVIQLDGPRGPGSATVPVTVGAPGAMPEWLAWLIGSTPLLFIAFWIWQQHRYRRTLLASKQQ